MFTQCWAEETCFPVLPIVVGIIKHSSFRNNSCRSRFVTLSVIPHFSCLSVFLFSHRFVLRLRSWILASLLPVISFMSFIIRWIFIVFAFRSPASPDLLLRRAALLFSFRICVVFLCLIVLCFWMLHHFVCFAQYFSFVCVIIRQRVFAIFCISLCQSGRSQSRCCRNFVCASVIAQKLSFLRICLAMITFFVFVQWCLSAPILWLVLIVIAVSINCRRSAHLIFVFFASYFLLCWKSEVMNVHRFALLSQEH